MPPESFDLFSRMRENIGVPDPKKIEAARREADLINRNRNKVVKFFTHDITAEDILDAELATEIAQGLDFDYINPEEQKRPYSPSGEVSKAQREREMMAFPVGQIKGTVNGRQLVLQADGNRSSYNGHELPYEQAQKYFSYLKPFIKQRDRDRKKQKDGLPPAKIYNPKKDK